MVYDYKLNLATRTPRACPWEQSAENGKVDPSKLQALIFDQFQHGYYVSGEQVGKAWNAGASLMKK